MSATESTNHTAPGYEGAYDTGLGTTPGMWQILSELIEGSPLPESLNKAIYALCEDEAKVVAK